MCSTGILLNFINSNLWFLLLPIVVIIIMHSLFDLWLIFLGSFDEVSNVGGLERRGCCS